MLRREKPKRRDWNWNLIAIIAFLALVLMTFVSNRYFNTNATRSSYGNFEQLIVPSSLVGKLATEFTVTDPADPQGPPVTLAGIRKGRPTVLFFNAGAGCGTCVEEMARLNKLAESGTVAVASILSSHTDSVEMWRKVVEKYPMFKNRVFIDGDAIVSRGYGALDLPSAVGHGGGHTPGHSYYIIDRDGIVRLVADDPTMGNWVAAIERLLKGL